MSLEKIKDNLPLYNNLLQNKTPEEIITWALGIASNPIITTNFRELSASLLHAVSSIKSDIPVIWVDTGYNTSYTYKHANSIIEQLKLNIHIYVPRTTLPFRNTKYGIPASTSEIFPTFVEEVKLEPFERAINEFSPDVWFSNLRKGQTEHRNNLDILSIDKNGVLKVSPFYYWSDEELNNYIEQNNLSSEHRYYDPTKVTTNSECGIHL